MEAKPARAGGAESDSLKDVFFPEILTVKSTEKAFSEDEFFVDGLLDFPNEDEFITDKNEDEEEEEEEEEEEKEVSCVSSSFEEAQNSNSSVSVTDDFGAVLGSGLDVPSDDLAVLEWLSHFDDDSFCEFPTSSDSLLCNPERKPETETQKRYIPEPKTKPDTVFGKPTVFGLETHVPAKARSKRSRITGRVWSYGAPRFTESSPSSSSSSSSSSLSFSSCLMVPKPGPNRDLFYALGKPPSKKQNRGRKPSAENSQQQQRRCTHCLVQKTPQWRTGPLGPKTLCNACGVRFKSGRLLPEYRPAGSPTFSSEVHSNSHRKVLEMRRKKEVSMPEFNLPAAVQSF